MFPANLFQERIPMRRFLPVLTLVLLGTGPARAQGLLIPTSTDVAPLAMVGHEVKITLEDQVAVTHVTQTFRNPTSRALEANYVFPVPKGASVKKFSMWMDGKEVPGELIEADKARAIYTEIVRRTQDPGLLEYLGSNLLRVRVFPVPAQGEQKLAISFTSVAPSDAGLVEYLYPLKADAKAARQIEKFTIDATLKAQRPLQNIYSPTHAIKVTRTSDREARIHFESKQETLDKDFQLFYTTATKDVGLSALFHRPDRPEFHRPNYVPDGGTVIFSGLGPVHVPGAADGHFMLLISPRAELSRTQHVARDMVFVLDTSGSMQGKRIQQARSALKFCLRNLDKNDRFGLIHFATSVTNYTNHLTPATDAQIEQATNWVDGLEAVGSTNIEEALATALAMRPNSGNRNFTIVFFTDGQPTIGECNPEKIVKQVAAKNTADTRIFTFGVGDDVNAVLLDQLAEQTRSVATYVRENEDIEAKVSGLYSKISHPVLTNLKLTVGDGVTISEVYPPQLPDLFHGSQLVVLGRYSGQGHAAVTVSGTVGKDTKEFVYEVDFKGHTNRDKAFVEDLWARRKVGYLLDQIRVNGENKELKDEVIALAKKYGITTPYTSYLVVPDGPAQVAQAPIVQPSDFNIHIGGWTQYDANLFSNRVQFAPVIMGAQKMTLALPRSTAPRTPDLAAPMQRAGLPAVITAGVARPSCLETEEEEEQTNAVFAKDPGMKRPASAASNIDMTTHSGKAGVDLALQLDDLRNQNQVARATVRTAAGRTCLELNGVWTDQAFDAKLPVVKIKAQDDAYFRMLERHQEMAEVFQLGNRVVWVTPSQTVLVIDPTEGQVQMSDEEIDRLFVAKQ
jgi:Ca-activated chloride channel family protein